MRILRGLFSGLLAAACSGETPFTPNYTPSPVFSNPTAITNAHLPLSGLTQDILVGTEGGDSAKVVRTRMPGTLAFTFGGQQVQTVMVVDSAFSAGQLVEVATDYFAQSDNGDVYYFGEDVDLYTNGQVTSHEGAWRFGVNTTTLGILLPASPKVGDKFRSEDVPGVTQENDEVVSVSETVTVPAGTYQNCVKIREMIPGEADEFKLYAPGTGVIQEIPADGQVALKSHT